MAQASTSVGRARSRPRKERQEQHEEQCVTLPLIGEVTMPPRDHLVFYAVLGLVGVLEIIEWPLVLIVGGGHFLSQQQRSPILQQAGEAASAA
ncbi:hypothetical protein [Planotetraspora mira]|uniref:Uncharacterized protein n=1 Tax=Planotetraspora mira TaxID=58121 RepID=A0A8J3U1I1_9ACTN|nr:hypothetical protein [Planotetraspora mira]GII34319.1 hypothetical protein Pmi06nite_77610 [Planotetraspora mira]